MDKSKQQPKEAERLFSGKEGHGDNEIRHLFEESAALNVYDKTTINLAAGCPGPDLLSRLPAIFKAATQHRMESEEQNNFYLFQYGPTAGWSGLRNVLAEFLTKNYGDTVNRADLFLSCGATYGLQLVVSCLLAPSAVIFVEEYTFMIALHLFREFPSFSIVKVPLTPDGVDVKKFKEIATRAKANSQCKVSEEKPFWAMFYTIPNFQNPTGCLLLPDSCQALVDTARELDLLVVCDDVYNLLYYGNDPKPPARLFSYDKPSSPGYSGGHIISNGSFSKILAPGVRVGWLEVPQRVALRLRQSGIIQSGGSVNNVMFGIMESVIQLGLAQQQLDWYKKIYSERMAAICRALETHLPPNCNFKPALGGYFIWIEVPVDGGEFLAWCKTRGGPGAVPSLRFSPSTKIYSYSAESNAEILQSSAGTYSPAIRVSIGFHDAETLEKAGEDLAAKLKVYMKEQGIST